MCSETSKEGWDFTPVINLINSLTTSVDHASHANLEPRKEPNPTSVPVVLAQDNDTYLGLGNFDNLWRYLGQPLTLQVLRARKKVTYAKSLPGHLTKLSGGAMR